MEDASSCFAGPRVDRRFLAWQRVSDIRRGAEEALISRSAGIVLMAEATRDRMSKKLQNGVIKPFTELDSSQIMEAAPVITALQVASDKAQEAGYSFRSPKMNPRNPANAPTELEKQVLAEQTAAATGEITAKVQSIQGSTEMTVRQIQQITQVIGEVNAIVMSIVTAVEEQSATTTGIAESISQASIGIQEVTENVSQVSVIAGDVARDIAEVNLASASISEGSSNVKSKAGELSQLAVQLQELVGRFRV